MYKRRRISKKKATTRSYAMVPRPLLNREMAHRHIVTSSSSTVAALTIGIPANGVAAFEVVGSLLPTSPNLSLNFSLAQTVINIGGVPQLTVPNPSVAELQQLYDTFQIEKVEITMYSGNTESLVSGEPLSGSNYVLPLIGHVPDTDDDGNTSLTQLQQYSNFQSMQLGVRPLKVTVVPCAAGTTFGVGYVRLQRQDVNVSQAATPHYGYKMAVDGFRTNPNLRTTYLSMQFRVHYLMKSTR